MSLKVNKLKLASNGFFFLFIKVFTLLSCQFMNDLVFEKIKKQREGTWKATTLFYYLY